MTPEEVSAAVGAIAADDSPAASSNLGSVVAVCPDPIVNVGIFFDGTYNDRFDLSTGPTNVDRLERIYSKPTENLMVPGGTCVEEYFDSVYMRGVGAIGGGEYSGLTGATGLMTSGILDRLEEATEGLRAVVESNGGFDRIRELRVDIFGFSRGAATARVFANALAAAGVPKLRTRFLGLFDTVGSFAVPGDSSETYYDPPSSVWGRLAFAISPLLYSLANTGTLDLAIRGSTAETVFQITAEDEVRRFFPLSSILPGHGTEVISPGSHGDIGGSYGRDVTTDSYSNQDVARYAFLRQRGWLTGAERTYWSDRHGNPRAGGWRREVLPGLTFASLHGMYHQAVAAEVPFLPLTDPRMGEDISVPAELAPLAAALAAGRSLPLPARDALRGRYSHRSWTGSPDNWIDMDHAREIYPNGG